MATCRKFRILARTAWLAALVIPLLTLSVSTFAQTTRAIVFGTVTDEKGAVVPNAKVIAKNLDTDNERNAVTDEGGRYRIPELLVGTYEVRVEVKGFKTLSQRGVELTVGREAMLDFAMTVGGVEDKIVIDGDATMVQTTTSSVGFLVNRKQIEELPLNGRDVLQLATLQNGVVSTSAITGSQDENGPGTTRLSANGMRIDFNSFLLDGTETSDAFGNSPGGLGGGMLGVDALREFAVLTANYSAEYGKGGGAIINAITKSGSNEIHGTAFEFLRNSALDARNFFNGAKLPFRRNQYGGSLGGPIIKNRTFLFGNYEGLKRREGSSAIFAVPSPAARLGNLTSGQITIAPSVLPYLALYPTNNIPCPSTPSDTCNYRRDVSESTNENFFTTRLDHKLTDSHSLVGRYTFDDSNLRNVGGVIQDLLLDNRAQYLVLEEQAVLSSRAVNVFRFGFSRTNYKSDFPFTVNVPASLGFIPGHQMGGFSIPGFTELRPSLNAGRDFVMNTFEVNDQFSYNVGSHAMKFGGMIRRYQLNANSRLVPDGVFVYGGGLRSFLLGTPQVLYAPAPNTDFYRGIRQSLFTFFAQDDWKIRPNITLNLGLRYEPISTPFEVNGKTANLRKLTDKETVVGQFFVNPSKKNFAPRLGVAWDVGGKGHTSVRAGFGTFYSAILPMRYRFFLTGVPPFMKLSLFPGQFPDSYARNSSSPIPLPSVLWVMQYEAEQPTVYQWNLTIQREVTKDLIVSAGYVGSRGVHLETGDKGNVRIDYQTVNGRRFYPAGSSVLLNPNFGATDLLGFNADSKYHALQLSATKRYSAGIQFQANYTFSKSLDTGSSIESVFTNGGVGADRQDPFDPSIDYGRSDFDARHTFVLNYLWDLPFGKNRKYGSGLNGAAAKFVGGWSVGGITTFRGGFPFSVTIGFDRARNGIDNRQSQRPDLVPGRTYESAILGTPTRYIDASAFQLQPAGFYGTSRRNGFTGPSLKNFDFSILKKTSITERLSTEFRVEIFNLFNHTNLAPPDAANRVVFTGVDAQDRPIVSSTFGQLTRTATTSRQMQFGLKLIW